MLAGMTCFVLAWLHFTQEILGKERAVGVGGGEVKPPGDLHGLLATAGWIIVRTSQINAELMLQKKSTDTISKCRAALAVSRCFAEFK
jgi:hypothetical protein